MTTAPIDHDTFVHTLIARRLDGSTVGTVIEACIDAAIDLLRADRGLLAIPDRYGHAQVHVGRRPGGSLTANERDQICRTIIARAQAAGGPVVHDPAETAPLTESMHTHGIAAAVAVALRPNGSQAGGHPAPVFYADFRRRVDPLSPQARAMIETISRVLSRILSAHGRIRVEGGIASAHPPRAAAAELLAYPSLRGAARALDEALEGEAPFLVHGETGTGKTLLVRTVAEAQGRAPVVRCALGATDDPNTLVSELFGHERGAFTGAASRRVGLVTHADGGILILDELFSLPRRVQALLLDFTQFGTYRPLGHQRASPREASVQIIGVTNGDIQEALVQGRFRQDLYYRLAGHVIHLPPLRERRAELPALFRACLARHDVSRAWSVSPDAERALLAPQLPWSGNIRELEWAAMRARQRAVADDVDACVIEARHLDLASPAAPLPAPIRHDGESSAPSPAAGWEELQTERERLDDLERRLLEDALERHDGVVSRVAREMGVPRTSLIGRMASLGLAPRRRR